MRNISILDDIEIVILQLVRAIPEVFLDYDVDYVRLVEYHEDGLVGSWDIIVVDKDDHDYEIVIGEASLGTDLFVQIDIYPNENELILTSDDIIDD